MFLRAATAATALSYSRVMGANDKIRLGVIGTGGRGTGDMGNFLRNPDVQVVARKSAWRSDPNSVKVEAVPHEGGITICSVYPSDHGRPNEEQCYRDKDPQ